MVECQGDLAQTQSDLAACLSGTPSGGSLPATGQTRCYNTSGAVIPCSSADWPGQDGFYQTGCSMQDRFVDNDDGTVTDLCTGLMWQKDTADVDGDGQITTADRLSWQNALLYCHSLELAGYTDWRLPNVRELQSIVDYGRSEPALNPVFGTASSPHWWYGSSSSIPVTPDVALYIRFDNGFIGANSPKSADTEVYVRAVRGGL